jgi:addiction module HigA family antidote
MQKYIELEKTGTIIREEFFEPYGVSVDDVANATAIPNWDLSAIIYGDKQISAENDLLLTKYFGLSQGYFLRMQDTYNMRLAKQKLRKRLKNVIPVFDPLKRAAAL